MKCLDNANFAKMDAQIKAYLDTKKTDYSILLAEKMGEAFSDLGWKIAGRFAPARDDITYQVLDRPLDNDEKAIAQYYDYLNKELPEAIKNAFVAYTNLCHKRTELFGM